MPRLYTLTASTALALVLPATAFAELTAAEVWENWQDYMASAGYEVTASEASAGDTLTVSDVTMSMDLSDDTGTGATNVRMSEIIFNENADGTVSIDIS
ncbi:MAG: hypothetical protein AAFR44_15015, partial [Pseudomonadota bacterium]